MKTTMVIAAFAVAAAIAVSAISINTIPSYALATGSISPEAGTVMGHVEYVVRDMNGDIKSYTQLDNMVVNKGDDCVLVTMFKTTTGSSCTFSSDGFVFIGIGNGTFTADAADTTLVDNDSTAVATNQGGLMAVKKDSTVTGTASSNGGTVTIATETPFQFVNTGSIKNTTSVTAAGLFDATCQTVEASTGRCTANGATMNMFAGQALSPTVAVSDGDSLDVTWTITVGNSS